MSSQPSSGPSRRAVVTTAAWVLPTVSAALAAPLAVASTAPAPEPLTLGPDGAVVSDGESTISLRGFAATTEAGSRPQTVQLAYSSPITGPSSAAVDSETGEFEVTVNVSGFYAGASSGQEFTGTVSASITGGTSVSVTVEVIAPRTAPGETTGTINFSPNQYRGSEVDGVTIFPTLTGVVTVNRGALPAEVILSFSDVSEGRVDLRRDAGLLVPINPTTGAFSVDGVYNAITGGENPFGFIYAGVNNAANVTYGLAVAELDG
ncbi:MULTISPECIES: hypothetical protein [unclassified Pseudoclavibacter]|uniref:hypothetical protein n=1 Tax=unclassified Pseudoclavibacter TaxID=2615177 RepID=UPI0012EFE654|nr:MULTISPECIES: hypothetical protein [unclassified Pseudoclavibacter]MBF4459183.1 hypothetical protein [Pseudoclavibacter sp. VKM Ac-2867]VXC40126.1 conserved exported hypothetical protein [Pseudoclavibacter sp. 8L]